MSIIRLHRRRFLHLIAGAAALPALPHGAHAEAYPARPLRLVVGFAAGGNFDIVARLIAERMAERLGQSIVVENRPGAGSNIAVEAAIRSPADGYTLFLAGAANAINATLYDKLGFDIVKDAAPVAGLVRFPNVMTVNASFPAKTVPEFIAYAKANPGKISHGSSGIGTTQHLAGELFRGMAGVDFVHVPYRGAPQALTDLLGGQVQVLFEALPPSIQHVRAGQLRALAVTTPVRSAALPDTPAMAEFLPGYEASGWVGICAPPNTPAQIIDRLNRVINASLDDPGTRAKFTELGATTLPGPPADFGTLIADETRKWGKVIRAANIKA
jgi:tripartite-type tricarboxylate transporter receptor subunit TctC